MGMPDGLAGTSRSQIDLLRTRFFYAEIVAAYRECVTASAFGRDSQYDFIVTEVLRCHLEIDHAVRAEIESCRVGGPCHVLGGSCIYRVWGW